MGARVKLANGRATARREGIALGPDVHTLMDKAQVCQALGIGLRKLESMMSAGEFPKPELYLAGAKWRAAVVNAWIDGLCERGEGA